MSIISPSEINGIEFYVIGSKDVENQSNIHVTRKNLFRDGKPEVDGPYDLHMGTMDKFIECLTCGNVKEYCPGHDGHIILKYPVQNPLFREEISKYLRIFCHSCGKIITNKRVNPTLLRSTLLAEYGKLARSSSDKNPKCCHVDCNAVQPHIEKDRSKPMIIWKVWFSAAIEIRREQMMNTEIAEIFDRINEDDLNLMGKNMRSHPRKFILNSIKVPSNTIRPDTKRGGDTVKATASDITTLVKTIVEINNELPKIIPSIITPELEPLLTNLDIFYNELVRGTSTTTALRGITNTNKPADSIASRIPKKPGVIRKNLLGKRLWYMARSVITGDKNICIDEVGVPLAIAKTIEIIEVVQEYNKDRLLKFFVNRERYPGCVKIERQTKYGPRIFRIGYMQDNARLEIDDIIYRHLVTGDWVCFNRQPSLLFCSIAAHRVVVMDEGPTLRLNSAVCNLYNADFDGDEMNLLIPTSSAVKSEIRRISSVHQWFIGYKSGKPRMGAFMDTLIGSAEFTRNRVKIDRFHAMDIISQVPEALFDTDFPTETEKSIYTGRDIISMIIPEEINFKGTAEYYNKDWSKYPNLKYHPDEFNVIIERGILKSGILDRATVGQEAANGLFHIIHNEYGVNTTLEIIYGFQQIINRFFYYTGFTVGIKDIIVSPDIHEKINRQVAKILADANDLTDKLYAGKLVSPVGMTLKEYYQRQMLEKLEHGDEFIEPLLSSIDADNNGLYKLIIYGSKGKKDNLISIIAAIGQFDINGKRLINQYSEGRSNIYFQRFDTSPEAGGYISTSYTQGIQQTSYIPAAQEARNGLISIALATAISGEQERKFIKSMESIVVNYKYNSMRNNKIVQLLYGENALDPRRMEYVRFPTISISDTEFIKEFKCELKHLDAKFRNKNMLTWLDDEFKRLQSDRNEYREIESVLAIQNPHYSFMDKKYVAVHVENILTNVSYKYIQMAKTNKLKPHFDPKIALEKIISLCDTIGYRLLNDIQEKLQSRIPVHIKQSIHMFTMLVRSVLCTRQLLRYGIWEKPLDKIIDQIKRIYTISLIQPGTAIGVIAAQSVSEPLTQFVLDTKHRSGAKGKQANIVDAIKEIVSAKPTGKMKNPAMILNVLPEYQNDKQKIQEIANHIEMMPFNRFITDEYIFFEEYGNPIHPDFVNNKEDIQNFEKYNFGNTRPSDITRWVILFHLDQEEMILKGMKIETIIHKIQDIEKFKSLYLVYSNQSAKKLFIRCYLRNTIFKKALDFNTQKVIELLNDLRSTIIRGIDGIRAAEVVPITKNCIDKDGSIKTHQIYIIVTEGTNLSVCLENPYLDIYNLHTNSVQETEEIYGIDAARQKIFTELKDISKKKAVDAHYGIIADEMTSIGKVTPLEHTGLAQRDPDGILLRTAFHGPIGVLTKSAINNKFENPTSVSSKLMLGTWPKIGTHYSEVIFDEDFAKTNQLSAEEVIDQLI